MPWPWPPWLLACPVSLAYDHDDRTHLSLDRNTPIPRQVEPASHGGVIAIAQVGGLHQRCTRAA